MRIAHAIVPPAIHPRQCARVDVSGSMAGGRFSAPQFLRICPALAAGELRLQGARRNGAADSKCNSLTAPRLLSGVAPDLPQTRAPVDPQGCIIVAGRFACALRRGTE